MGFYSILVCALLFFIFERVKSQVHDSESCVLANGKAGRWVRFENCPSAIDMVTRRDGTPKQGGLEGPQSIVCCDFTVGEISKQKCKDYKLQAWGIVGGVDAKPAEFTHMAALGYGQWSSVTWGCGGSLISEKFVLTAAHCINTPLGQVKYVRVGDLNLNLTTEESRPQDFTVTRSIVHPKYKGPSVYHDIAIIELSANVIIDKFVRPGCLNTETQIADDEWIATGWGVTRYQGSPANHLQKVQLHQFTQEQCQAAYASTTKRKLPNGIDFNSQVCAGEKHKDTCQGDSGGPLQIKNTELGGGYKVIGVTSFGKACGIGNSPSVYTRVSFYINWIESIVWPQ